MRNSVTSLLVEGRICGALAPAECQKNDLILKDCINYCISKGNKPIPQNIVRSLYGYRGQKTVGMFPIYGSKALFSFPQKQKMKVLDFSAGFGQRLVAAWASNYVESYTGVDACHKTVEGLRTIKDMCNHINPKKISLICDDAKNFLSKFDSCSIDMIFTSPPYFDREYYSDEQIDSSKQYPVYQDWLEDWLFVCIQESLRILKTGGYLALNIANCIPYLIADDVCKYLECCQVPYKIMNLHISNNKKEPLIISKKEIYK